MKERLFPLNYPNSKKTCEIYLFITIFVESSLNCDILYLGQKSVTLPVKVHFIDMRM